MQLATKPGQATLPDPEITLLGGSEMQLATKPGQATLPNPETIQL